MTKSVKLRRPPHKRSRTAAMASSFRRRRPQPGEEAPSSSPSTDKSGDSYLPPSHSTGSSSWLAGLRGTKPSWASSGIALTSTGLADLDAILGGGQPLGTCVMLALDDRAQSSLGSCLLRCWCAEALSQGHHLLVLVIGIEEDRRTALLSSTPWIETDDDDDEGEVAQGNRAKVLHLLRTLPRNRHHTTKRQPGEADDAIGELSRPSAVEANALGTLNEEGGTFGGENDDDDDDDDDGEVSWRNEAEANLKIAWQYSKAEQSKRQGSAQHSKGPTNPRDKNFCHKYDLSGTWSDSEIPRGLPAVPEEAAALRTVHLDLTCSRIEVGYSLFGQLCDHVLSLRATPPDRQNVIRMFLYMPDDDPIALSALSVALPLFLAHVRSETLPVVALVATASSTPRSTSRGLSKPMLLLRRTCDAVLEVENFACRREYPPPAEFRHLHGLLKVRRAATHAGGTAAGASSGHFADWTVAKRPAAFLYGLKRNRRSLAIPMLHIPPEEYAEGGGSVGAGGVRSGAGRPKERPSLGCSSSGGGSGASSLDF